ncbi:MAG: hypothetical protein JNG83_08385 [Opitutaceae bacterium]|nr:hypothetical protein [Opitutaceae bacterium]
MNASTPALNRLALASLALVLVIAPSTVAAEDAPKPKLSKAKEAYDADKDGVLNDEEMAAAREGAKAKAKATREANRRKALEKYDANHNGEMDDEEVARKKADEKAAKEAKQAEREARRAEKESRPGQR